MRILDITLKDLRQLVFDWRTALFLLLMPIGFTLLFAFVFGGVGGEEDPRLPVGFVNQDGESLLSAQLLALLDGSDSILPEVFGDEDLEKARAQVADEELAALVIVPAGYSQALPSSTGSSQTLKPVVIADLNSNAGQAAHSGLQAAFARLLGAVEAANLTSQAYEKQGGTANQAFWNESFTRAIQAWADPPLTITASESGAQAGEDDETRTAAEDYAHSSAGIMVQFAMAGLIGAAEIVVLERKSGTMRRLLTTPATRIEIILGHFFAMLVMILAQLAVLILFGQLLLGVDYLQEPLGTLLMLLTTALWAASLGLLIGIFARTEEQIIIYSIGTMLVLSGLGGAWMPLEFTSKTFQTVGHLTPTAWAIDGFENIVVRGLGLDSVLLPAAVVLGFAVVFFAVAVWRFRFE
jgi:ABC-2 type transport system permease protein